MTISEIFFLLINILSYVVFVIFVIILIFFIVSKINDYFGLNLESHFEKLNSTSSKIGPFYLKDKDLRGFTDRNYRVQYYHLDPDFLFLGDDYVLYLEENFNETYNQYITENYEYIVDILAKKGYKLMYLPKFLADANSEVDVTFLKFKHPLLNNFSDSEIENLYQSELQKLELKELYKTIIKGLKLKFLTNPIFLVSSRNQHMDDRFLDNYLNILSIQTFYHHTPKKYRNKTNYSEYNFRELKANNQEECKAEFILFFQENIFSKLKPSPVYYQKVLKKDGDEEEKYDADYKFDYRNLLDPQFRAEIDAMFANDESFLVADAVMYMLFKLKKEKPELITKILPIIEKRKLLKIENDIYLSQLFITKRYEIILTDYGNIELKMAALPKTVYILFLRHPEGILIKRLCDHKQELLEIYQKVTNKSSNEDILQAIDDLVDNTNPSINQKCSRIKEAIMLTMSIEHSKYYFIQGERGEPKKILLPPELIVFES